MENEKEEVKEVTEEAAKPEGLSLRDALEVAVIASKDKEEVKVEAPTEEAKPVEKEVSQEKTFDPPAEWSAEEKEDFKASSPKSQEAALRLHRGRQGKLEEIKREAADLQWAKDLAKEVEPYIKSVGGKKKTHEALIDALKMRREFDEGDPRASAAAYLKAKGIEIPKELLEGREKESIADEKIAPLQNQVNALTMRIAQEDQARTAAVLNQAWGQFEQEKNAAGAPRFPDIATNSESGLRLASYIGSLVSGQTDLSKQFIANAKGRIPDLSYQGLLTEAYRFAGGKVDDSEATKTQDTQKHIARSSRAAASKPGSGARSTSSGPVKKYKTYREAAEAALAEFRLNSE